MTVPTSSSKDLRPCFSCSDKNEDIKKLHVYIGALKKRIDLYEGTWFSPPQMKEERNKVLRLEHCRDSLLKESRCQQLTIKAQSEATQNIYTEAEVAKRVREYPIQDGTKVFPVHHQAYGASTSSTSCQGHGSQLPPLLAPVLSGSRPMTTGPSDPILAPILLPQSVQPSTEVASSIRKRKRPTRSEKNQKRRNAIAALEASLSVAHSKIQEITASQSVPTKKVFRVVPAGGTKFIEDHRLPVDIDEMLAEGASSLINPDSISIGVCDYDPCLT